MIDRGALTLIFRETTARRSCAVKQLGVNAFGLHYQLRRWSGRYVGRVEHVCFYSPETLHHLFDRHGSEVTEMYGAYTELPFGWKQKVKFAIGHPLFKLVPILAGTIIVVATPKPAS